MAKFKAPQVLAADRKMLSVTPETHASVRALSAKHGLNLTRMIEAIVQYHVLNNEEWRVAKILTPKTLIVIPQMDLKYNIKKLTEWKAKQDKENGRR